MSFEEHLRRARAGDTSSRDWLVELAANHLGGNPRMMVRPPVSRRCSQSDVVQEAMLRICKHLDSFDSKTEKQFLAWAETIGRNLLRDVNRKQNAGVRDIGREEGINGSLAGNESTPSAKFRRKDAWDQVLADVQRLPEDQRAALNLRYNKDLKMDEIATEMGKSSAQVVGLIRRALEKLQRDLGRRFDSFPFH